MGCVGAIQRALGAVAGVQLVQGDPASKTVTVEYDDSKLTPTDLLRHLDEAGFPSTIR